MRFYVTTENPNVMMRENHNTQPCEYIIIFQDGLYIVSTTPEEILYMLNDKYKINIYLQDIYPHDPGGKDKYQIKEYLENLYENMNILLNGKLPTNLHTVFQIIKLLIEKGNLNLIHNKNTYQHLNCLSRKRKLDKLYNEKLFIHYKTRFYISTLYIKFHRSKHYLHFNIPIYTKQEELIHDCFI